MKQSIGIDKKVFWYPENPGASTLKQKKIMSGDRIDQAKDEKAPVPTI